MPVRAGKASYSPTRPASRSLLSRTRASAARRPRPPGEGALWRGGLDDIGRVRRLGVEHDEPDHRLGSDPVRPTQVRGSDLREGAAWTTTIYGTCGGASNWPSWRWKAGTSRSARYW